MTENTADVGSARSERLIGEMATEMNHAASMATENSKQIANLTTLVNVVANSISNLDNRVKRLEDRDDAETVAVTRQADASASATVARMEQSGTRVQEWIIAGLGAVVIVLLQFFLTHLH